MDETTIKYVNRSKYRVRTLKAIGDGVKMPKEIAEDSGILQNHISNVLRELKDKDLVECLNPNARKGRLYRLSDDGKDMLDKIK
ncbi:transcriptional regulator [Methanobrevibacter thaueri]|nr:transcriptional regulator [Methanobrevibacter thaueri]